MGIDDYIASGNSRLDRQLLFTAEIDRMTSVLRRTLLVDGSRRENDAEHSWHIAVMAMLFSEYAPEPVDIGRAVRMCVVHDLVEIEAGDTFAYDASGNEDKAEREKAAADKLFSSLPEEQGSMIRTLWEEFDAMDTPESRFAAALDRLQPFYHNVNTEGFTWKEGNVRSEQVLKRMDPIREALPALWDFILKGTKEGVEKGYIRE